MENHNHEQMPPKEIDTDLNRDGVVDINEAEAAVHVDQWKNRRSMAYFSLRFFVFLCLLFILVSLTADTSQIDNLDQFNSIFVTVIGGLISVVLAYFGTTAYVDSKTNTATARPRAVQKVDDPG